MAGAAAVAGQVGVAPFTAKTHVSRIMVKLGARERGQLVIVAYESGLVRPGWLTLSGVGPGARRASLCRAGPFASGMTRAPGDYTVDG